jgi:hypothetical protein
MMPIMTFSADNRLLSPHLGHTGVQIYEVATGRQR